MAAAFNGLLEFNSEEELNNLLIKMDNNFAIKLIELALEASTDKHSLLENHILYNCIKKLKQNETNIS